MDEDSKPPEKGFYLRSNRLGMKLQSITEIIIEDSWKEKSVGISKFSKQVEIDLLVWSRF